MDGLNVGGGASARGRGGPRFARSHGGRAELPERRADRATISTTACSSISSLSWSASARPANSAETDLDRRAWRSWLDEHGADAREALQSSLRRLAQPGSIRRCSTGAGPPTHFATSWRRIRGQSAGRGAALPRKSAGRRRGRVCLLRRATRERRGARRTGARATVRLWQEDGAVRFEVSDDGVGFDTRATPRDGGLTRVADTIGALGGAIDVESEPGRGTRVAGSVPGGS